MRNIQALEKCFKKYLKNLGKWAPENLIPVDLALLNDLDLLHYHSKPKTNSTFTRYFNIVETPEKITLVNEDYVVWIVPEKVEDKPITFALIALNKGKEPKLEVGFLVHGIYNTSQLVLNVLEKFLIEIQENEEVLAKLK